MAHKQQGGSKRKQTHAFSDQYGEAKSQDRDDSFQNFSKGSQSGGGSAGGPSRTGADIKFERHVPKFLQPYAHMLGKGSRRQTQEEEEEPVMLEHGGADEDPADDLEAVRSLLSNWQAAGAREAAKPALLSCVSNVGGRWGSSSRGMEHCRSAVVFACGMRHTDKGRWQ